MNRKLIQFIIVVTLLSFPISLYAEETDLLTKVSIKPWYENLSDSQKKWIGWVVERGFKFDFPTKVGVFSLDKNLSVYKSPELKEVKQNFPPIPHALSDMEGKDVGGHMGKLLIHIIQGDKLKVTYKGTTGWIERSSVRIDSLVLTKPDGTYDKDLFLNVTAGGSRARLRLFNYNKRIFFVFRYILNYRGEDEKFFGFEYSLSENKIVDIIEWGKTGEDKNKEKPLKSIEDRSILNNVIKQIGIGKTGFLKYPNGRLEELEIFYPSLKESSSSLISEDYIIINSSMIPGKSPVTARD